MEMSIIILRLFLTFLLSLIFGLERQRSHKPIGFGSFIFVSIGSCALAIVAVTMGVDNPLPLLGAIITGIGFLGAGALIKTTDKIFGFTTAASIWVFAIFGLVIGVGDYLVGSIMYLIVWAVIFIDGYLVKKGIGTYKSKLILNTNRIIEKKELEKEMLMFANRFDLINIEIDKKNKRAVLTYLIESDKGKLNKLVNNLYTKEWFESCKID